ncbi:hypothetical protein KQI63_05940 [bacterium]|nr:hypothetical protein [bacterium]
MDHVEKTLIKIDIVVDNQSGLPTSTSLIGNIEIWRLEKYLEKYGIDGVNELNQAIQNLQGKVKEIANKVIRLPQPELAHEFLDEVAKQLFAFGLDTDFRIGYDPCGERWYINDQHNCHHNLSPYFDSSHMPEPEGGWGDEQGNIPTLHQFLAWVLLQIRNKKREG